MLAPKTEKKECCLLCSYGSVLCLKAIGADAVIDKMLLKINNIKDGIFEKPCTAERHDITCCKRHIAEVAVDEITEVISNDFYRMFKFIKEMEGMGKTLAKMLPPAPEEKEKPGGSE